MAQMNNVMQMSAVTDELFEAILRACNTAAKEVGPSGIKSMSWFGRNVRSAEIAAAHKKAA